MYIVYILAKSRANAGLYDNVYEYVYEDDYDYVNDYESGVSGRVTQAARPAVNVVVLPH